MPQRLPITVRLESFEGPLDLLLYLIQSHELDISTVSISRITDQYLAYIRLMKELNFDTASEFLVLASTLLHWKSKSLLPDENKPEAQAGDEPVMTQDELVRQLLEHQRFRAAGQDIAGLPTLGIDTFKRAVKRPPTERVWREMNITTLARGYQDLIVRARRRVTVLHKETVSLAEKIREFKAKLAIGKLVEMKDLIGADRGETRSRRHVPRVFGAFAPQEDAPVPGAGLRTDSGRAHRKPAVFRRATGLRL